LHVLGYGYFASHQASGTWPRPGNELLTGGSPRYRIYPTADGRHIACAALEKKFWDRLVQLVGLEERFHDDASQEQAVIAALGAIFASRTAAYWRDLLDGEDVCTVVVATWDEAVEAGLVDIDASDRVAQPAAPELCFPTMPSPVDEALRSVGKTMPYPALEPFGPLSSWT
jgi:crotonobetainyl-CoA:carnitine CoA-transferase CaiB-like acyl-CoA transferase